MLSTFVDTLEGRALVIAQLDWHFRSIADHESPEAPVPELPEAFPTAEELLTPVARMRPRRQVVRVRGGRVCARRLRH
jgi:hypothetical protein